MSAVQYSKFRDLYAANIKANETNNDLSISAGDRMTITGGNVEITSTNVSMNISVTNSGKDLNLKNASGSNVTVESGGNVGIGTSGDTYAAFLPNSFSINRGAVGPSQVKIDGNSDGLILKSASTNVTGTFEVFGSSQFDSNVTIYGNLKVIGNTSNIDITNIQSENFITKDNVITINYDTEGGTTQYSNYAGIYFGNYATNGSITTSRLGMRYNLTSNEVGFGTFISGFTSVTGEPQTTEFMTDFSASVRADGGFNSNGTSTLHTINSDTINTVALAVSGDTPTFTNVEINEFIDTGFSSNVDGPAFILSDNSAGNTSHKLRFLMAYNEANKIGLLVQSTVDGINWNTLSAQFGTV